MRSKPEPPIWSCDTGQQISCYDSCQLNIIWMSNIKVERFSFEYPKVIGFALATLHDWLKKFVPIFHPIRSNSLVTHSHTFSCTLRQLPVITSSFDWFTVLCVLCDWLE